MQPRPAAAISVAPPYRTTSCAFALHTMNATLRIAMPPEKRIQGFGWFTGESTQITKTLVVDVLLDGRGVAAHGAGLVAAELELAELHAERVVGEQAAVQRG